jgi:hypothetical protein
MVGGETENIAEARPDFTWDWSPGKTKTNL